MPNKKSKNSGLNQKLTLSMKQVILFVVIFGLVTGIAIVKSFAAPANGRGGSRPGGGTSASCSAPPTTVGSTWTVTGNGLPPFAIVQFLVSDSTGAASSVTVMTNSSGSAVAAGHAYIAGTDKVKVTDTTRKFNTLATCSFQVS